MFFFFRSFSPQCFLPSLSQIHFSEVFSSLKVFSPRGEILGEKQSIAYSLTAGHMAIFSSHITATTVDWDQRGARTGNSGPSSPPRSLVACHSAPCGPGTCARDGDGLSPLGTAVLWAAQSEGAAVGWQHDSSPENFAIFVLPGQSSRGEVGRTHR